MASPSSLAPASDSLSLRTDRSRSQTESSSESQILFFPTSSSSAARQSSEANGKFSSDTVRPTSKKGNLSHNVHDDEDDDDINEDDIDALRLNTDESQPLTSSVATGNFTLTSSAAGAASPYRDDVDLPPSSGARTPFGPGHTLHPGAYWRMAEQIPSTRSLEARQGGSLEERRSAYWKSAIVNVVLILSWYTFSTLISVYNKWMFSTDKHNFSFPLFVTSFHMLMQFGLSSIVLRLFPSAIPKRNNGTRARPSGIDWISKVVPCALATALDIGLSNTSLKTITLTFYTMCKSSNLAFVLFFAFLFGLEVIRWSLIGIISLITLGVVLMVAAETKFVFIGAVQVLSASALGGLRWALTQMLLDRDEMGMNNPIATIFWLSPVMGGCLISLSAIFESWHKIFTPKSGWFDTLPHSLKTMGLIAAPGFLAFGMNLAEFALIKRTSVVTLSVAGIFKEVLTIALASSVFGDELTPINITGLCITLLGITLYNYLKYRLITRGADSVGQEIAGMSELSESIRSRASSIFRGGRGASNGHLVSSSGHTERGMRSNSSRGYQGLRNGEEDDDGDGSGLLFDREREHGHYHATSAKRSNTGDSDALELDTQRVSQEILSRSSTGAKTTRFMTQEESEKEKERLRKIQEEADMDGWTTSGERLTGQGLIEEHHHHR